MYEQQLKDADERAERAYEKSIEKSAVVGRQRATIDFAEDILRDVLEADEIDEGLRLRAKSWLKVLDIHKEEES